MPLCTPGSSPEGFRHSSEAPELEWGVAQGSVNKIPLEPIPSWTDVSTISQHPIGDVVGLELKQGVGRKPNSCIEHWTGAPPICHKL